MVNLDFCIKTDNFWREKNTKISNISFDLETKIDTFLWILVPKFKLEDLWILD